MLRKMIYHSQFGEDRWIMENFFKPPVKGVFVEVGAFDGIQSSNTLAFEEAGMTGLCIEPDPELAAKCRANRKAITLQAAIGLPSNGLGGLVDFYVNDQDRGISSLTQHTKHSITVPLLRLDFVIASLLGETPWLLSIDTEGNELECFESLAPRRDGLILPKVVIIEFWSQPAPPKPEIVCSYMSQFGYHERHRTEVNCIFVR